VDEIPNIVKTMAINVCHTAHFPSAETDIGSEDSAPERTGPHSI